MSHITELTSVSQLEGILSKSAGKLSIIDFHATWCGPCHAIAPVFLELSNDKKYSEVNFLKCDVDAARDVASKYSVSAMPTFVFIKGSSKVDELKGANRAELKRKTELHHGSSGSGGAFSGKGQRLGGGEEDAQAATNPAAGGDAFNWGPLGNLPPQARIFALLIGVYLILLLFKK